MKEIYLDNSATTPVSAEVAACIAEMLTENWGNPSSLHRRGLQAQLACDEARAKLAAVLGAQPGEITFTSGATEANNLALFGAAEAKKRRGNRIVTTGYEHASVDVAMKQLEAQGFEVVRVYPGADGCITPEALAEAVDEKTVLLSAMMVNNESGARIDIARMAALAKQKNPELLIHCDAVQALCKYPIRVGTLGIDLLTVSGHKIFAPKGIGALWMRRGVRILPRQFGGLQERSLRPGTENTAYICGFGLAAERLAAEMAENFDKVSRLCEYFNNKLQELPQACINSPADGTPYIRNISLPGVRSEIMLHYLEERGIYVSSGSACAKGQPSHVLTAMGLTPARADSALRISFSRHTTEEEIDTLITALGEGYARFARPKRPAKPRG